MNTISIDTMASLSTLYTQPHRKYHNINHINDCLTELESIPRNACISNKQALPDADRDIVETAIWYHDAIYNPYSKHNEERSAELLPAYDWKPDHIHAPFYREVKNVVLATAKHLETQENISLATQVMLDIDLAGFGKDRMVFATNGMNIRHEYYNTKIWDFLEGRRKFYEALIKRPTLYYTEHFYNLYHEKSRENMEWEMLLIDTAFAGGHRAVWGNGMENATEGYF